MEKENKEKGKVGKKVAIILFSIAVLIGGFIIIRGVINNINYPKMIEANKKRMDEISSEIADVNAKLSEEFKKNQFSKEYYTLNSQLEKLQEEKTDLSSKNFKLEHNSALTFIVPGIMVIIFGGVISMIIYNTTNPPTVDKLVNESFGIDLKEFGESIGKGMASVDAEPEYKTLKCPNCGNNLDGEEKTKCKYCGATLEKVYKRKKKETK